MPMQIVCHVAIACAFGSLCSLCCLWMPSFTHAQEDRHPSIAPCPSVALPTRLCLSLSLSLSLSLHLCLSVSISVSLSLCVCISICLYLSRFISLAHLELHSGLSHMPYFVRYAPWFRIDCYLFYDALDAPLTPSSRLADTRSSMCR
jgi:hypothetical protein